MFFAKLDDSPMFREQIQSLEESAESLRDRCLKFYKGCHKYTEGLGEGYDGDIAFASSLEMFGGGHNDPISVAFGGPVMTKFTIALREIGTYKEVLRSQIEHILNDRLLQFVEIDSHSVKDARKLFDKATLQYDQAREKYLSLKKGTKADIVTVLEDELHNARSSFEKARFNLVTALFTIESKKKFEFLEAVSGTMEAHLRYFKQGYELLRQMEPYIHQVLAYAQQSRERSNYEHAALIERMQEFKRQIDQESQWSPNGLMDSSNVDGMQAIARSSHKMIEAVMQSAAEGKVQTIRQGYLSKRSSNLRGDWKRRFFVLDSQGMLYYYRKEWSRASGGNNSIQRDQSEHGPGLLSRWFSSHYHSIHDEKSVPRHTVNLLTSTIKIDADQSDLRFCFRIISPTKNYTLQAESAKDQMDWIEKITGVIASLLNSQSPEQHLAQPTNIGYHHSSSRSSSFGNLDDAVNEELTMEKNSASRNFGFHGRSSQNHRFNSKQERTIDVLRKVHGNNVCAECGAPDPDWASLNLGVLLCIECSGVHRNLGVHISKVRSLTLDVRAWDPSVINLFQSLGNTFANSIWEELLPSSRNGTCENDTSSLDIDKNQEHIPISKPRHLDPISVKEKFIHLKYADKCFVSRPEANQLLVAQQMWESVNANDKKAVYRLIVTFNVDVNITYEQASLNSSYSQQKPSTTSFSSSTSTNDDRNELDDCFQGFSLLHLACWTADIGMIELLIQYGANSNSTDSRRRTPLHHCILKGRHLFAKLLLSRGADPHATDDDDKTPLQYAIESGDIDYEDLLALLDR
ncbi:ADP-ribosylation factor GTPase-activating protein AGD3-like [Zingiber officinale]|uniref:Uncharacterized protein n=1 Tax=Zingiber officinale TaxID=94328 RepID=A0A8J5HSW3_ZINOF|nr:ADP-ribosylation factor GTPase-activating protein AGD3-like [Zingiber officinale]KAG6520386.1 hypothetical protein ZIOFF_017435 [Zingiber officinale]